MNTAVTVATRDVDRIVPAALRSLLGQALRHSQEDSSTDREESRMTECVSPKQVLLIGKHHVGSGACQHPRSSTKPLARRPPARQRSRARYLPAGFRNTCDRAFAYSGRSPSLPDVPLPSPPMLVSGQSRVGTTCPVSRCHAAHRMNTVRGTVPKVHRPTNPTSAAVQLSNDGRPTWPEGTSRAKRAVLSIRPR